MTGTLIIGDIGGTHTRLAQVVDGRPQCITRYLNREQGSLEACVTAFLHANAPVGPPLDLCLAVAAPVSGDAVTLTNLDWHISCAGLQERFGCRTVTLLNDFAALACALPALGAGDLLAIGHGTALASAPSLIIGPGTGFGASLRLPSGEVVATEGGHALAAASTAEEAQLLDTLRERHGPVSIEQLVSGPGLLNLYREIAGGVGEFELTPEALFARGVSGNDVQAARALDLFFAFLGIAARNLALACGARGGVYLAGGILPRYRQALLSSQFRRRFETPTPIAGYLPAIPTWLVVHDEPALLGLAYVAQGSGAARRD